MLNIDSFNNDNSLENSLELALCENISSLEGSSKEIDDFMKNLPQKHKFLKNYQYLILQYFLSPLFKNRQYLLISAGPGRGKSLLTVSCAIAGLQRGMFEKIIILCPKAIIDEFEKNLLLYFELQNKSTAQANYAKYLKYFIAIAYNSWMAYSRFKAIKNLEKTLFVIDESHIFFKAVIKVNLMPQDLKNKDMKYIGNCKRIYDIIYNTKHKKVLALTGTPSSKHPFSEIPGFNLSYKKDLFDNNYLTFCDKYIDFHTKQIVHVQELRDKIDGLVAYVPDISEIKDKQKRIQFGLPVAKELELVYVEMSEPQYKQYLIDYEKELKENAFSSKKNVYGLVFGSTSSFHSKTFQDALFWNESLRNYPHEDRLKGKLIVDNIHCPKIVRMYKDSEKIDGCVVFYFKFVNVYGCELMAKCLEMHDYEKIDIYNIDDVFEEKKLRYIMFTGEENSKFRNKCKDIFNDERNKRGDFCRCVILSGSGLTGITLKNTRLLSIGSVSFNVSELKQLMARCNRIGSHSYLPVKDRTIEYRLYLMKKNKSYYLKHKKMIDKLCSRTAVSCTETCPTIETIIYYDSLEDQKLNDDFIEKVLIPASITNKLYKDF